MELLGQSVGARDQRQGDKDLDREVVDDAHGAVGGVSGHDAEEQAAPGLLHEQARDPGRARRLASDAGGEAEENREQDDADAVVEQGLALHLDLQGERHLHVLQGGEHRHRIGRADQGAEDQRPGQANRQTDSLGRPPEGASDHGRRDDGADQRQGGDRPGPVTQGPEVERHGAGEEQERQHPVHHDGGEVDLPEGAGQRLVEMLTGKGDVEENQQQRGDEPMTSRPMPCGMWTKRRLIQPNRAESVSSAAARSKMEITVIP